MKNIPTRDGIFMVFYANGTSRKVTKLVPFKNKNYSKGSPMLLIFAFTGFSSKKQMNLFYIDHF